MLILLVTGLLELLYPDELRYRNGVLVFYLGIRVVGFPLGTLAFYAVNLALSSELSAITKLWVYWTSVLLVGGIQWLVLVPVIVRGLLKGRGKASLWSPVVIAGAGPAQTVSRSTASAVFLLVRVQEARMAIPALSYLRGMTLLPVIVPAVTIALELLMWPLGVKLPSWMQEPLGVSVAGML